MKGRIHYHISEVVSLSSCIHRCVHCQTLAPIWDQLANKCADSASGPRIAKVSFLLLNVIHTLT